MQNKDFKEPWANKHPDPSATGYYARLYYGPTLLKTYILVSVDGGRATLPLPDRETLQVTPEAYFVASLFDSIGTLDQYMGRSGLTVAG